MDIGLVIDYLRPGAKYKSYGTYKELEDTWEDDSKIPTQQEMIDAEPAAIAAAKETAADAMITPERELFLEFLRQEFPALGTKFPTQAAARTALRDFYRDNS